MLERLKSTFKRKLVKWGLIGVLGAICVAFVIAVASSVGGSFMTFLLSFQQQSCSQEEDSTSGAITVSGYSKSAMSKAIAVAEAVGADLHIKPAFVFAQLAAETGIKDTREVREDNNFGGIKYSPSFSSVATVGNLSPEGDYYARFKTIGGFATIYRNTVKNNLGGQKPKTWAEYVHLMKVHGYFTDDEATYVRNGQGWFNNYDSYAKKYGGGNIKVNAGSNGSSGSVNDLSGVCADGDDEVYTGTWTWPFKSINGKPSSVDGGQFGPTSYPRGSSNFHDGFDFSSGLNGVRNGSAVVAVTNGVVYKVGYNSAAEYYIWLKAGEYNVIYQEGFGSKSNINVSKGDKVKIGQKIGTFSGTHLHLGITTDKKNPAMRQQGSPVANGFDHPECWLNPITVIQKGLKK